MSVNVPLLRKYVEWVEEQEARQEGREWWQGYWATKNTSSLFDTSPEAYCDTAYCVAGKVAVDHGWTPVWRTSDSAAQARKDGEVEDIVTIASGLLGVPIAPDRHDDLFAATHTAADIRRIAEELAGERL